MGPTAHAVRDPPASPSSPSHTPRAAFPAHTPGATASSRPPRRSPFMAVCARTPRPCARALGFLPRPRSCQNARVNRALLTASSGKLPGQFCPDAFLVSVLAARSPSPGQCPGFRVPGGAGGGRHGEDVLGTRWSTVRTQVPVEVGRGVFRVRVGPSPDRPGDPSAPLPAPGFCGC